MGGMTVTPISTVDEVPEIPSSRTAHTVRDGGMTAEQTSGGRGRREVGQKGKPKSVEAKLRIANKALREQVKEFARALDAALKNQTAVASAALEPSTRSMKVRAHHLRAAQKRVEVYKKANKELKRQLVSARIMIVC